MKSLRNITHGAEKKMDQIKFKVKDALNLFDPVIIFPYCGYGNGQNAYVRGRVLEKERILHADREEKDNLWTNIRRIWKRYESDEIKGVTLEGELLGVKAQTVSNEEGYFTLEFNQLPKTDDGWHEVRLKITDMPFDLEFEEEAKSKVLLCNQDNAFGIISDVDDTIIQSHAMNSFKKLKTMIMHTAETRVAFDGVDDLYRALMNPSNPLFFVSGSAYNLYDMLVDFCEHNNIPKAPFFLRDIGLDPEQWIKRDTSPYKKDHIEHIFSVFDKISFICIGDSGQKDPEIYIDLHKQYPSRIKAIYIRHVHTDARKQELQQLADSMDIPFLVMEDSRDALAHATKMGWVKS